MELLETRLSSNTIFEGRVFHASLDTVRLSNGKEVTRERIAHNGGVGILAITDEDCVPMVRQFRYGVGKVLLEIPAGKLERGENPEECGRRELREECALIAGGFEPLGTIIPTPAYCSEVIHLFLATALTPSVQQLDEDEFLTVTMVPFADAVRMAVSGEIEDAKSVAALLRAALLRQS